MQSKLAYVPLPHNVFRLFDVSATQQFRSFRPFTILSPFQEGNHQNELLEEELRKLRAPDLGTWKWIFGTAKRMNMNGQPKGPKKPLT
jgi:hypothetical protein